LTQFATTLFPQGSGENLTVFLFYPYRVIIFSDTIKADRAEAADAALGKPFFVS
jgi:hypothetical protein